MNSERIIGPGVRRGTFVKTASPQVIEVLGSAGLDFGVVDAEHAAFDRNMLDLMLMAGRASGIPLLVRVPDSEPATILQALDMGAAGILVPHVDSAALAEHIVACARYRGGRRGYSGSPRAHGYGSLGMKAALDGGDRTLVLCQIECPAGLEASASIAAVPGVAALFVGRADLALSMGLEDSRATEVTQATIRILRAALGAGRVGAMFAATVAEAREFELHGASSFVIGSDQSMLRDGAQRVVAADKGSKT